MTRSFPSPPNDPFERIQANDGMFIAASHWKKQENYHRRYQKENYQSWLTDKTQELNL